MLLAETLTREEALKERSNTMAGTWDVIKGQWKQLKGEARSQWGKLTDDDWDQIAGDRDKLVGQLQTQYGWAKIDAEREVDNWMSRYGRDERSIGR
jgi:uncharacterized protein YjbJ (UPF0337 family)